MCRLTIGSDLAKNAFQVHGSMVIIGSQPFMQEEDQRILKRAFRSTTPVRRVRT